MYYLTPTYCDAVFIKELTKISALLIETLIGDRRLPSTTPSPLLDLETICCWI